MIWLIIVAQLITTPADSICVVRGHISSGMVGTTLMYSEPRYVDLEDMTIMITHDPNIIQYKCERCGELIREPIQEKPDTIIIWQRGEK